MGCPLRAAVSSLFCAAGVTLAACGGGTSVSAVGVPQTSASATASPASTPSGGAVTATPTASAMVPASTPTATPSAALPPTGPVSSSSIYLGDIAQGAVLIYASGANGPVSPSAIIAGSNTGFTDTTGTSPIYGIAVDASGTAYVLTQTTDAMQSTVSAESILVFPAGTTGNISPSRTIGLSTSIDAESLAYSAGNLYVTDDSGTGAVDVFPASASGASAATRAFTDSTAFPNLPLKVSVDASGNTYVATYDQTATAATEATQGVYEFQNTASGSTAATLSIAGSNTGFANGVLDAAVVDANGRIDAALDDATTDTDTDIDEFSAGASGNATPATTFQDATSQGPVDAAIDASGNLYVSEVANSKQYAQVDVFTNGAKTPQQTILAYQGVLPLIAIGPYVAPAPSGSMTVSARRVTPLLAGWRQSIHHRGARLK